MTCLAFILLLYVYEHFEDKMKIQNFKCIFTVHHQI